jgi:integrase
MSYPVTSCQPETARVPPEKPERQMTMTRKTQNQARPAYDLAARKSLAQVLAAVDRSTALSPTRLRDLRSAVMRVANLLGNDPGRIALDLPTIATCLAAVNPVAAGMTTKRFANIRSDFLAAVKASGLMPIGAWHKGRLATAWRQLFARLSHKRAHLGLSRLARYASARGIDPAAVNDVTVADFITAVREQSLHGAPNWLYRQVTLIWNKAACNAAMGLQSLTVPSFRRPPKRIDWALLSSPFRRDVDKFLKWSSQSDPFAPDSRSRRLAPRTLRLRRDQIHAAVSALVDTGIKPTAIGSLADLVTPANFKRILQRRLEMVGGAQNSFNHGLGIALTLFAREWVKVDGAVQAELKRLLSKVPLPLKSLTDKNKRFLRQFDDPNALRRLVQLPEQLWAEVKRERRPTYRTLAKAQAALAIGILIYMPIRLQNLVTLEFERHLFIRTGRGAKSTLELSNGEVKNNMDLAFEIPPQIVRMLVEYRERAAPKIIGERPVRLFVNVDGTPKVKQALGVLITSYARRRAGITLTPHQARHLSAKVLLDDQPGGFETVRQILGHKSLHHTVLAYAGIDSRRAGRHHQNLIEEALSAQNPSPPRRLPVNRVW